MENEGDQHDVAADALRRDAGPPPDFELVRPFVASIGTPRIPGQHGRSRHRSLVTADSVDSTQEIHTAKAWTTDFPQNRDAIITTRWRAVPLSLMGVIVLLTGATVAYFISTAEGPTSVSLPVAPVVAMPAATLPSQSPLPSISPSPSTGTHPHEPARSAHPSPPEPSPSRSFAGGVAPPPTPSPSPTLLPPPATPVTGLITGIGGLCVDDNGRVSDNGNAIQVYGCNGTPAQDWTFEPNATVQVLGKCLQVTKPAVGGRAELWDCTGDPGQAWRRGPSRSLVNVLSGLCLEDPNASQQPGTQLDIDSCTGAADEAWTTPF